MTEKQDNNHIDWSFPNVENALSPDDIMHSFQQKKEDELTKEKQKINKELNKLKFEYENKIETLNTLLNELQNPAASINDELIEIMQTIIKKSIKLLISKEINLDPNLTKSIITELKKLIKDKNGTIHVSVSEIDHQRLDSEKISADTLLTIDNSLKEGDVIIKSKSSEIRALLDERIEQMIKAQHD